LENASIPGFQKSDIFKNVKTKKILLNKYFCFPMVSLGGSGLKDIYITT